MLRVQDTPCTPVREYRTYRVESYGELRSDVVGGLFFFCFFCMPASSDLLSTR